MDQEPETPHRRIRRSHKCLREQESEIRAVTVRNRSQRQSTAVNIATLDLQIAARATRTEIDRLVAMSGKGTMDSCNSDSSTGGSLGLWETSVPRPPTDPPPRRPRLPPGCPHRTAQSGGRTQGAPAEADPLRAVPQIKTENPKPSEGPNGFRDGPLWASTAEDRRVEMQRALREQEWTLGTQAWTTTEFGLESEART